MKKYKVVIVGGGSTWTPGLLKSLCVKKDEFPLEELILFDVDKDRQEKIARIGEVLFREEYPELKFSATTDKEKAYSDVDFVFCQIRTGGYPMRQQDEHIPFSHNVIGQETCGPGGFAYGLRSVRDMIEIVNDARKYGDPYILNYSNPAAIVAVALDMAFPNDKKIINMCDQPVNLLKSYGKLLGRDYTTFTPIYFGLNHFGWFKNIFDEDGKDITCDIKEEIHKQGFLPADAEERDQSWLDTYGMVQMMLEDFPDYVPNTYLQYYLYPQYKASKMNNLFTRADEVMAGREKRIFEESDRIYKAQTVKGSVVVKNEAHSDMIVDVAISIITNSNRLFVMITRNNGVIANINNDAMVECTCMVNKNGVMPTAVGEIGTFEKGLIENQYAYEKLVCESYFESSYKKALQALTLNRVVVDAKLARAILDDLIEANSGYFPEFK